MAGVDAARDGGIYRGLKILELGAGAAGPVATGYFAEHGATVIRIESAVRPDFLRLLHVTAENRDDPDILDKAPMFVLLNPNKQSLTLNLKKPESVALVKRLAGWADVVSENFAPGVMDRFGLDYAALRDVREDIIMVSGCLFGQTGPQRAYPGFGGQGSAIAGFNHMTGHPEAAAHGPYGTITDSLSPRYVALAISAALHARRKTGRGQYIDVSQIETGVYSLSQMIVQASATGEIDARRGNREVSVAPHSIYPCRGEERWIAIAALDTVQWSSLLSVMNRTDLASDPRFAELTARLENEEELDLEIANWTRNRDAHDLMATLQKAGVEAGVVQNLRDLLEDPQLAHREHFERLTHTRLGELAFERSGFRIRGAPDGGYLHPGPLLGEHNRPILEDLLGLSADEVRDLVASGAVG